MATLLVSVLPPPTPSTCSRSDAPMAPISASLRAVSSAGSQSRRKNGPARGAGTHQDAGEGHRGHGRIIVAASMHGELHSYDRFDPPNASMRSTMAINFDLNDLLAFRAVAELSNFRRAAEAVHISQPAFSRRIEKLEQALGVRLLDRTTRRVSLTAVGRDFARKVQRAARRPGRHAAGHPRRDHARAWAMVTVASVPSTVNYYVSQVIRRYREIYPKVRIKMLRCRRQRRARRGGAQRGRLRHQLHRQPGARHRVQAAARGAVRRRLPARPPAGEAAPRHLGRAGGARLHRRQQVLGQPPPARPGAGRRRRGGRRACTRPST